MTLNRTYNYFSKNFLIYARSYQSNILYDMIIVQFAIRFQGVNLVDYIYYIIVIYSIYKFLILY